MLKDEITRIARKELRGEIAPLRKSTSQQRSAIASLKRTVATLERLLRRASKAQPQDEAVANGDVRHRFSAKGLAHHRKTLGLSAAVYGQLIGVTGQTIYKWEEGKAKPRAAQLEAIAGIRGIGKREAANRLDVLAAAEPSATKRPRAKRAAS